MAKSRIISIALGLALSLAASGRGQTSGPSDQAAPQQWGNILLGRVQPPAARNDAAARLAGLRSQPAQRILAQALQSWDPDVTNAAAKALAEADWADPGFIAPLERLLGASESLNGYVADALDQYGDDPAVAARLLVTAQDDRLPAAARAPVVSALGVFGMKDVADGLIQLVQNADESDDVRQAAAMALAEMTGQRQYGLDTLRWQAWWRSVSGQSPAEFAAGLAAQRSKRFAEVVGQIDRLTRSMDRLLKSLYFTSQPADQPRILEAYFSNESWPIRRIGAQIVEIDVGGGHPMSGSAKLRLRALLANDPQPEVRAAAAEALGLDPTAADVLLNRLAMETDLSTRVALINALALRQDSRAMAQAVRMVGDPSVAVAGAAADLIAVGGAPLRDARQAILRRGAKAALLSALQGSDAVRFVSLRRSLVAALGALGEPDLQDRLRQLAQGPEAESVRAAAIDGLGLLAQTKPALAADLADLADGPEVPAALRLKAVQDLAGVPTSAYVDRLVDRLHRKSEPQQDVRQAIWQTVTVWMANLNDRRLLALADRLARERDYPREIEVRRVYVQRLEAQKPATDAALIADAAQRQAIARRELDDLGLAKEAAAEYAAVLAMYQAKAGSAAQTRPAAAVDPPRDVFTGEAAALLAAAPPYEAAVKFTAETLADPKLSGMAGDVLEQWSLLATRLANADPNDRAAQSKAIELVNAFTEAKLKLPAALAPVADQLAEAAATARQNLARLAAISN